jgi:hypothetical protein
MSLSPSIPAKYLPFSTSPGAELQTPSGLSGRGFAPLRSVM